MSGFKKAERKSVKVKLAITGPSGSGKTYSALLIAKGLVGPSGKIAVIDTENDSASLYSGLPGMPDFDSQRITPPFLTDKYIRLIKEAVALKYDALIIDSTSHQWNGEGGILDRMDKEKMAKQGANTYTMWAKYTPEHEAFKAAINNSDIHIVSTLRSKQDYVLTEGKNGKQTPQKVGMAPIQREGAEYDYTVVFDMSMENYASVSKDRTSLFMGKNFKPSDETGMEIAVWLQSGKIVEPGQLPQTAAELQRKDDVRMSLLLGAIDPTRWPKGSVNIYMQHHFKTAKLNELTEIQFAQLLDVVKTTAAPPPPEKPEWERVAEESLDGPKTSG